MQVSSWRETNIYYNFNLLPEVQIGLYKFPINWLKGLTLNQIVHKLKNSMPILGLLQNLLATIYYFCKTISFIF